MCLCAPPISVYNKFSLNAPLLRLKLILWCLQIKGIWKKAFARSLRFEMMRGQLSSDYDRPSDQKLRHSSTIQPLDDFREALVGDRASAWAWSRRAIDRKWVRPVKVHALIAPRPSGSFLHGDAYTCGLSGRSCFSSSRHLSRLFFRRHECRFLNADDCKGCLRQWANKIFPESSLGLFSQPSKWSEKWHKWSSDAIFSRLAQPPIDWAWYLDAHPI
jgi:hypothetical protein